MLYRRVIHVSILLFLLALTGCAAGRAFDTDSPEERRKSSTSKDDLWNQTISLEKEKAAYQKQLADQQAELDRLNKELADQQLEINQTSKQATELTGALDDLTAKVKQLQDARRREHPLKEANLAQQEKPPGIRTAAPRKEKARKSLPSKGRDSKSRSDRDLQMKPLQEAEQKIPPQEAEPTPLRKEQGKEPPEARTAKRRSVDDLSAQMKQFEEARQKGTSLTEAEPGPAKKEILKKGKKIAVAKKEAQTEPAEPRTRESGKASIKVLAGDGSIASAKALSKQLGKMGYRVKLVDQAPRSDFEATMVYYGTGHRGTAETMAKKLGGGALAKPLTWSSSFDIIVVTGRKP